jgi:hypothetical protein
MENLLYYPYINLPRSDWSTRSLLYYDKIGVIVPQEYLNDINHYDPFMQQLLRSRLVKPVNPLRDLRRPEAVTRKFVQYLEDNEHKFKARKRTFKEGKIAEIHSGKFAPFISRIHSGKFDYELFYQLEHAGLAKRQRNERWYNIEQTTANELMTFTASVIGVKLNYLPATDELKRKYFKPTAIKKNTLKVYKLQKTKREVILERLIPFPEDFDLKKLRKFKDKHYTLLMRFKRQVEGIVLNPAIKEGSDLLNNSVDVLIDQRDELSEKMNEYGLKNYLISVGGIVGASGGLEATTDFGLITAAIGITTAIVQAINIEKPEHVRDQTGLKYLALADKRLRISRR